MASTVVTTSTRNRTRPDFRRCNIPLVAMASDAPVCMLGGGNPAHIPELEGLFADELDRILKDPREYRRMLANYPSPAGEQRFRATLAELLSREYGWSLSEKNIAFSMEKASSRFTRPFPEFHTTHML